MIKEEIINRKEKLEVYLKDMYGWEYGETYTLDTYEKMLRKEKEDND